MPIDYRRFNGPEGSVSYYRYTEEFKKAHQTLLQELLDDKGLRKDGRKLDEKRSSFARANLVSQAKGSAYVELKRTKVICSVFDPREIPRQSEFSEGQLYCEVKFAPFSCPRLRRSLAPEADEKALSVALKNALESAVCTYKFPNYQIDIFVYILENDGSCLAAAINAAGIALTDAAVPMYDIITACSLAVIGDKIFVDPTEAEEQLAIIGPENGSNHGVATMSMLSEQIQVSDFTQIGSMDAECMIKVMNILKAECEKIVPHIQQVIIKNTLKCFEENKKEEEYEKKRASQLKVKMEEWTSLLTNSFS